MRNGQVCNVAAALLLAHVVLRGAQSSLRSAPEDVDAGIFNPVPRRDHGGRSPAPAGGSLGRPAQQAAHPSLGFCSRFHKVKACLAGKLSVKFCHVVLHVSRRRSMLLGR